MHQFVNKQNNVEMYILSPFLCLKSDTSVVWGLGPCYFIKAPPYSVKKKKKHCIK